MRQRLLSIRSKGILSPMHVSHFFYLKSSLHNLITIEHSLRVVDLYIKDNTSLVTFWRPFNCSLVPGNSLDGTAQIVPPGVVRFACSAPRHRRGCNEVYLEFFEKPVFSIKPHEQLVEPRNP